MIKNRQLQYMVQFEVFAYDAEQLERLIPNQKVKLAEYAERGFLLSYRLNMNKSKHWAIFNVSSEHELLRLIDDLPMTMYMDFNYDQLISIHHIHMMPTISLN